MCENEMSMCEERVTMQVAAVQWDKVERKNRVLETHSALLMLQTLLMQTVSHAPVREELSHAIHAHSLVSTKNRLTVSTVVLKTIRLYNSECIKMCEKTPYPTTNRGFGRERLVVTVTSTLG